MEKPKYVNESIRKVSTEELKKALKEVNKKNKEIRDSFKIDANTLSFRVY